MQQSAKDQSLFGSFSSSIVMHASCYFRDRLARDPSRPAQVEILIHPHFYSPAIFSAITLVSVKKKNSASTCNMFINTPAVLRCLLAVQYIYLQTVALHPCFLCTRQLVGYHNRYSDVIRHLLPVLVTNLSTRFE